MASPVRRDTRRYRRRILAIGAALFGLLYIVMAPVFVEGVESDLEERVPTELAEVGFPGIVAAFHGQDGTLTCTEPLSDPEAAREAAYAVWGVHSIELDRTCRVNVSDEQAFAAEVAPGDSAVAATSPDDTEDSAPSSEAPADPGFESLAAAVSGSPQLSLLAVLLDEADLTPELADPGADPATWFAPTDAAFEMLPADFLAALRSDPDTLRTVLRHHATAGRLALDDLTTGPLQMSDGSMLDVDADRQTIGAAAIHSDSDVDATNGMLHVIDSVLLPADLDPNATLPAASVQATFSDADTTLSGTVADDAVRVLLVAATVAPGATASDELVVDAATGLDQATAQSLSLLIAAGRDHLTSGAAGFDGEELYIMGAYATDADRDAVLAAADAVGVEATLTPSNAVTSTTEVTTAPSDPAANGADALEDELNAIVRADPILFEMNRSTITPASGPTLDRIAQLIDQSDGVRVVVEGHTDSDGDANDNLWLSRFRARAVRDALVARGVGDGTVTWEGFGSQHPIVIDGVEDKPASRRVEFRVEAPA